MNDSLRQVAQPTESAGLQTCEPCQTGAGPGEQETSSQEKTQ